MEYGQGLAGVTDWLQNTYDQTGQFLATPEGLSVLTGMAAAGTAAGIASAIQRRRFRTLPSLPSRTQLVSVRDNATEFYRELNNAVMAVTDAWNQAQQSGAGAAGLAEALRLTPFTNRAGDAKRAGQAFLEDIAAPVRMGTDATAAARLLGDSWDYENHDQYRTEIYWDTEVYTDSQGRTQTRMVMKTRQVYEHTDHYFTFHKDVARQATDALCDIEGNYDPGTFPTISVATIDEAPDLKDKERILRTILEDEKAQLPDEKAHELYNEWNEKAEANKLLAAGTQAAYDLRASIGTGTESLLTAQPTYTYRTYSPGNHSGPEQYQRTRLLEQQCLAVAEPILETAATVNRCLERLEHITQVASTTAIIAPDEEEPKPEKTGRKAIDDAIESYLDAFPGSTVPLDQRPRASYTAMIAAGAGVVGGLIAYFVQTYGQ